MATWHDLGSLEELRAAGRLVRHIGGREIGAVLDPITGSPVGFRNRCPHHGGPLFLGSVRERLVGGPGSYALAGERVLRCPWHGWEFDLATGVCRDEPSLRAAVYPARVADGRVLIEA